RGAPPGEPVDIEHLLAVGGEIGPFRRPHGGGEALPIREPAARVTVEPRDVRAAQRLDGMALHIPRDLGNASTQRPVHATPVLAGFVPFQSFGEASEPDPLEHRRPAFPYVHGSGQRRSTIEPMATAATIRLPCVMSRQ